MNTQEKAPQELRKTLREIESGARQLQKALLSRNTHSILEIVAEQENTLELLKHYHDTAAARNGADQDDETIHRIVDRTRHILRTNQRIAQVFLEVIDQTIASIAQQGRRNADVYARDGSKHAVQAPVIIEEKG